MTYDEIRATFELIYNCMLYLNMTQKCVTKEGDQQNLQPLTRVKEINQTTASASKRSLCV